MKLAVGQAASQGDIELNVREAARLLEVAAEEGADLLVLPELFLSGYIPHDIRADPGRWALSPDDPRLAPLRDVCRNRNVAALVGAPHVDEDGALRNAVFIAGPSGNLGLAYSKVHLWAGEADVFTAGRELQAVYIGGVRIGLGVCYDAGFPEFVRAYARAHVDVVVFSSAFASGEEEHRYHIYHASRALESGLYVAVANGIGPAGDSTLIGRSQIFDPQGHLVADAGSDPGIATHEILPGSAARLRLPYLSDLISPLPVALEGTVNAYV